MLIIMIPTAIGIPKYGYIAVIELILFLLLKDIVSAPKLQRKAVETSLNLVIMPLLVVFIATVAYKIAEILS